MGFNMSVAVGSASLRWRAWPPRPVFVMLIYLDNALNTMVEARRLEGAPWMRPTCTTLLSKARLIVCGQNDDRVGHHGGAVAHFVQQRDWFGGDAAHCRAAGRGMISSTLLTLIVIPAIYGLVKARQLGLHRTEVRADMRGHSVISHPLGSESGG